MVCKVAQTDKTPITRHRRQEKVVESLVDCLGGKDDKGEDVIKAGNTGKEDTTKKEIDCNEPSRGRVNL